MNGRIVWEFSVTVASEAEEAVAELFARVFAQQPITATDLRTRTTKVSIYSFGPQKFSQRAVRRVEAGLRNIERCGLDVTPARLQLRRLRQRNWAEAWKKQFKPIRIGSALLIKPSWSKCKPRKDQAVVVLDPGQAFGTGHHPTTAFCLRQIVSLRRPGLLQSFLDIGTGSGILAIAAAKLGYEPVVALDCDPKAVRIAKANVKRNKLTPIVRVIKADVATFRLPPPAKFDVVCANLNADVLVTWWPQITRLVASTGALVLAGVLESEFDQVRRVYEKAGFALADTETEKNWQSALFVPKSFKCARAK